MPKLGNLEDHFVHFSDHRQAKRITVVGTRIFSGNSWGEMLDKPLVRCLKPAFFGENVGESQCYSALKSLPAADFSATEKALRHSFLSP